MLHRKTIANESGETDEDIREAVRDIASSMLDRRADFLVGAGMSVESRIPGGFGLLKAVMADRLGLKNGDRTAAEDATLDRICGSAPFEVILQAVQDSAAGDRAEVERLVSDGLRLRSAVPSAAHRSLASCISMRERPLLDYVYTTNFDNLIQEALGGVAHTVSHVNCGDLDNADLASRVRVVHLHGRLDAGDAQFTESDVFDPTRAKVLHNHLMARLVSAERFIFVGYSMSDPDMRRVHATYRDQLGSRGKDKKTYAVVPVGDITELRWARRAWESRRSILIPLAAGEFFAALQAELAHYENQILIADLCAKFRCSEAEIQEKITRLVELLDLPEEDDAIELLVSVRIVSSQDPTEPS